MVGQHARQRSSNPEGQTDEGWPASYGAAASTKRRQDAMA
jgi:hypothetical protein